MIDAIRFWAIVVLVALGVFFTFVSAVGVIRLPDVYARAHTASQVDTLGAGFTLAAVALALGWQHAAVYTVLLLFFVFITNPTAAHAIARSAAESGIEPWTVQDARGDADSAASDASHDPELGSASDFGTGSGSGTRTGSRSGTGDASSTDEPSDGGFTGDASGGDRA